jgi:hypothetical protein
MRQANTAAEKKRIGTLLMGGFVDRLMPAQSYIPDQHQMYDGNVIDIMTLPLDLRRHYEAVSKL